jgi:CubicO group peptidase (beta-lactamase class C family)
MVARQILGDSMRHALLIAASLATAISSSAAAAPFVIAPAQIDAVFKDYGPTTPGCSLGVYSAGKVLYAKGYGMADLNLGAPNTPQTVFDIGSTSKQFTAAAILLLVQDGKVKLSDDIHKYIPELPDYGHLITVDNLLRHTSGLRDYDGLLYLAGHYNEDFTNDDDALQIIVAQKALNFEPGTRFSYSNTGFFLMSVIVKRVTGQTLAQFAKARMFTPLGMEVTHFRDDHNAILKNRAVGYDPADKGGFKIDMSDWDQLGDGAVNTNVLELARWDANFSNPTVGGQALVDGLGEPGKLDNGKPTGYGRGQFLDSYRGLRRIQHGGAWAGYRAMLMRFPDQKLSIGMTCNISNAGTQARAERVADVVLAGAFTQPAPVTDPKTAPAYAGPKLDPQSVAGAYVAEVSQDAVTLTADKGVLSAKLFGQSFPLTQIGPRRFTVGVYPIEIEFSADGQELRSWIFGEEDPPHHRVAIVAPTPAEIAAMAGRYRSAELGTEWTVRVEKGVAYVKGRAVGDHPLEPINRDVWVTDEGFFAPSWSADGRVTGFDFSASRMTRIRFEKIG